MPANTLDPQRLAVMSQRPETRQEMQSSEKLQKTTSLLKSAFDSSVASETAVLRALCVLYNTVQYCIVLLSPLYCYIFTNIVRANYKLHRSPTYMYSGSTSIIDLWKVIFLRKVLANYLLRPILSVRALVEVH